MIETRETVLLKRAAIREFYQFNDWEWNRHLEAKLRQQLPLPPQSRIVRIEGGTLELRHNSAGRIESRQGPSRPWLPHWSIEYEKAVRDVILNPYVYPPEDE